MFAAATGTEAPMSFFTKIESDESGNHPVIIKNDHDTDRPIELRIGEAEAGRTRFVRLTPS
ncbi:MAG: hypothetical protein OXG64_07275 [Chloroflexi bacterium]|nr:hypothetical protein [Chloroflexota bacterium]